MREAVGDEAVARLAFRVAEVAARLLVVRIQSQRLLELERGFRQPLRFVVGDPRGDAARDLHAAQALLDLRIRSGALRLLPEGERPVQIPRGFARISFADPCAGLLAA